MSLFNKLNQIKDLKSQAKDLQGQLAEESITVEKHGTTIIMDGNQKMTKLDINPEYLNTEKKEKLEELLKNLHSDAIKKVQRVMAEKMRAQGGFNLPGM
ncbi:YbaB/EbfC family nucleoid-associated protein [bacterium]|jgi:DNA-binding protein YbaB|nr:YbaB/EbfC family nucleoid-associated protein [bacterium]MBT4335126.1 YbaB/EbfC family nucleoid-associated protein [bacterium]MBT4495287.1 YbaB/EbfC family nucleoid-associated protein [bacterium]MBT4763911.1 YbaB/EbfC family nucleoid-associated protein [bacterium]MBT5401282.1 YbaB/EbfC family nucleoid-associated protein [bacterium]